MIIPNGEVKPFRRRYRDSGRAGIRKNMRELIIGNSDWFYYFKNCATFADGFMNKFSNQKTMETTIVKMGNSLGVRLPDAVIKDFHLKAGTKIEINFISNGEFVLRNKSGLREGWDAAFAQYALDGEDQLMLPDFLDPEVDTLM